ncbi:sugar-transfer associated ATP-grasp domain-containing protein [Pelomonas sp. SE-A7]|uniref:sugar-transfer associated ATP-grasp domain-containing protein n=1 Tax=Pelomonas sp. SE-A7 TaxID=3054953 RepID=UPI00259CCD5E|nr:sugar-transfer associated ATP-grasp domain-containing protein [Pelomonas sp. SE-A7]MDM4765439.1 sugar-transfer associated ATP-grasp domain-containing protein [Pelomonas sp. SE-A7]
MPETWRKRVEQWLASATAARAESGRGLGRQLVEALLLRLPPSRLGLSEYYDYRLFDASLRWQDRRRFVGWRGEPALDRANAASWRAYADDKLLLTQRLSQAGVPQPRLHCTYLASTDPGNGCPRHGSAAELADWLRQNRSFPLFLKPVHGGFGRGAALIEGYVPEADQLLLDGGRRVSVGEFVASLLNLAGQGLLIQECMAGVSCFEALLSGRLSTLRVMTLDEGQGPRIFRAIWKLPRAHNIVDNFESGTLGNLLAAVDLDTGRVKRVIQGFGLGLRELDRHPDSGLSVEGLTIPDWGAVCDTTLQAARLLPGLRFQHWDVALAAQGPTPIEVNLFAAGGAELSQLVEQRGLLEPRLLAQCRR